MSSEKKGKFYILNMFPYPSGDGLHVGHALGYVASDIYARYKKAKGFKVLNPMGYDSFGLPAEQYAIQTGQHPTITTQKNTQRYTEQLKNMSLDFDWDRSFCTSDPKYYKYTQQIFIWMFNSFFCLKDYKAHKIEDLYKQFAQNGNDNTYAFGEGKIFTPQEWNDFSEEKKYEISLKFRLAYQDDIIVNWCPKLGTVLANDEVKNGFSERGGYPVEQRKMRQWCLRITAYADRLLEGLNSEKIQEYPVKRFFNEIKKDLPIIERKIILTVIKHWSEDKFLIVRYNQTGKIALLTEGIEDDESPEKAVIRGLKEETGYVNIRKIIKLNQNIETVFYQEIKQCNRHAFVTPFIVELADSEQVEISKEEKQIQTFQWLTVDEMEEKLKINMDQYVFQLYREHKNDTPYIEWPESTKQIQCNWIGRSEGAKVFFEIQGSKEKLEVFTTRPETIFGVTFIAISRDHSLAKGVMIKEGESGILINNYVIHPFTKEQIPIWVTDYVLSDYGTGAVMAVPAHDQRDKDFAKRYNLVIKQVIDENNDNIINSNFLNGLKVAEARRVIINKLEANGIGKMKVNYKLRDAVFSRQRYWGEPIPIYYKNNLPYVFEEKDLPLLLPDVEDFTPTGKPPLANIKDWKKDGYEIETSTMPGWAGSSWYYLRYLDAKNEDELVSEQSLKEWGSVDLYLGGVEHATGHLLYARFYAHFLFDIGKIPYKEPFKKLIHQGMILGESAIAHRIENTNTFVSEGLKDKYQTSDVHVNIKLVDADFILDIEAFRQWRIDLHDAQFILEDGKYKCSKIIEKMSKSKHNVVNPDDVVNRYGVDTLRMYLMFLGPIEQQKPWSTKGIEGVYRFLNKVKTLQNKVSKGKEGNVTILRAINRATKEVGEGIDKYSFNTAISSVMICLNTFNEYENISEDVYIQFLLILYPFAPKTTLELLTCLNFVGDIKFPDYDEKYLVEDSFDYPIAINGKVRFKVSFGIDENEDMMKQMVLKDVHLIKYVEGKEVKKIFVIKNKMINVVV